MANLINRSLNNCIITLNNKTDEKIPAINNGLLHSNACSSTIWRHGR